MVCFQQSAKTAPRQNSHTGPFHTGTDSVTTDHRPLATGSDTNCSEGHHMVPELQKQDSFQSGGVSAGTDL